MNRIDGPGSVPPKPDPKRDDAAKQGGAAFDAILEKKTEEKKTAARSLPGTPPDLTDFLSRLRENDEGSKQSVEEESSGESHARIGEDRVHEEERDTSSSAETDPAEYDARAARETERGDERSAAAAAAQSAGAPIPIDTAAAQKAGLAGRVPPQVLHRMVESVRVQATREGGKEMHLELRGGPGFEGMGLKVLSQDGKISAVFVVDQLLAKDAIEKSIPEMRQRLEAQGLQVSEIRVEVRGGERTFGGSSEGDQGSGQRGQAQDGSAEPGIAGDGAASEAPSSGKRGSDRESSTDYTV